MELTLTVKGDTLTPEVADLLQKLGIALQGGSTTEVAAEPEPKPEKKTRAKKAKVEEATEQPAATESEEGKAVLKLETIRAKAKEKLDEGKSTEFRAILKEHGLKALSDIKPEDYEPVYEKVCAL